MVPPACRMRPDRNCPCVELALLLHARPVRFRGMLPTAGSRFGREGSDQLVAPLTRFRPHGTSRAAAQTPGSCRPWIGPCGASRWPTRMAPRCLRDPGSGQARPTCEWPGAPRLMRLPRRPHFPLRSFRAGAWRNPPRLTQRDIHELHICVIAVRNGRKPTMTGQCVLCDRDACRSCMHSDVIGDVGNWPGCRVGRAAVAVVIIHRQRIAGLFKEAVTCRCSALRSAGIKCN